MAYESDERLEKLAAELIEKWHPHLKAAKIAYLLNDAPTAAGQLRLGKKRKLGSARRVPEIYESLTGFDFIIQIKKDIWDKMDPETQEALLDHELCHCGVDGDGCYIREHDVTEFAEVIERHGFWLPDVRSFYERCDAAAQRKLPFQSDPPAPVLGRGTLEMGDVKIEIDMDRTCKKCGGKGVTGGGVCLRCVGNAAWAML